MHRRDVLKATAAAGGLLPLLKYLPAEAAGREGTLLVVTGFGPNSMDIQRSGSNRPSYQVAVNLYDRLLTYGRTERPDGAISYDYATLAPELAESWEVASDGLSATFHLRRDATFWDGTPVTAADVKWSFDRAVSVGGFPTVQMRAGSLENPEQFVAVDDHTFRIDFIRPSKLTLPDLAVPVPIIFNSTVARAHATEDDPWATDYLHRNPAGSGAFMLERWDPGQQVVYRRNDNWASGVVPGIERVIIREVPSSATRRALLERGDADVSLDLPPRDTAELQAAGGLQISGVPIENCVHAVGMNVGIPPFDDVRVRQAVAFAIPYEEIFRSAAYERGVPMYGATSPEPSSTVWPQPFPYTTDYDRARALLVEAGLADGFDVPLSFNMGLAQWTEPTALLIQEGLRRVGIRATLDRVPGANWRTRAMVEKSLPLHLKNFGGWLNYPDYYFYWVYQSGRLFNSMSYSNAELDGLVDTTLHMATDHPDYAPNIRRLIRIAMDEVPLVPLWQPFLDVAMQPNVQGYEFWFHRQLDARPLRKAST